MRTTGIGEVISYLVSNNHSCAGATKLTSGSVRGGAECLYLWFCRIDQTGSMASCQCALRDWQHRSVFLDCSLTASRLPNRDVARNLLQNFYHAAFPAMVRDLPKMIESEQMVLRGEKRLVLQPSSSTSLHTPSVPESPAELLIDHRHHERTIS